MNTNSATAMCMLTHGNECRNGLGTKLWIWLAYRNKTMRTLFLSVVFVLLAPDWRAYGHCEACFRVNGSAVLTIDQAKDRFSQIVVNTPKLRGQSLAKALTEASRTPVAEFSRLFNANTNVVGVYCQGAQRLILFQDEATNIYLAEFSTNHPSAYRVLTPNNPEAIPDRFDSLFNEDLAPTSTFSVLRVLDLGIKGMALMGESINSTAHFVLSHTNVVALTSGRPLPQNADANFSTWITKVGLSTGKPVVIWGDPFLQVDSPRRVRVLQFLTGLQKAYPSARIVLDDPAKGLSRAIDTIASTTLLKQGESIKQANLLVVTDAAETGRIQDFGLTEIYTKRLQSFGVPVVQFRKEMRYEGDHGIGVIVLTAHSDEKLAKFVDELCGAGYFQGNLVMVNSCATPLTKSLLEKIIRECGALATFGLLDSPNATRVEKLIIGLTSMLSNPNDRRIRLFDAYNQAIWTADMRGLWQTSWAGAH